MTRHRRASPCGGALRPRPSFSATWRGPQPRPRTPGARLGRPAVNGVYVGRAGEPARGAAGRGCVCPWAPGPQQASSQPGERRGRGGSRRVRADCEPRPRTAPLPGQPLGGAARRGGAGVGQPRGPARWPGPRQVARPARMLEEGPALPAPRMVEAVRPTPGSAPILPSFILFSHPLPLF